MGTLPAEVDRRQMNTRLHDRSFSHPASPPSATDDPAPTAQAVQDSPRTVALPDRLPPAYQEVLEGNPEAVSDRGGRVRSGSERPPARGTQGQGDRDHETDDHHAGLR